MLTLADFIDRKRQLEIRLATHAETLVAEFERETGAKVESATIRPITERLCTATVEVRL